MRLLRRSGAESTEGLHLVVGLGNPGGKYEATRHNIGWTVVEELGRRHDLRFKGSRQRADVARGTIGGRPVLLALPLTYMNESGLAVSRLLQYYKIPLERLLVVADDLDLPFGTLRTRPGGSSGGQRGIESIIRELGTDQFARLRLGIGRPPGDTINYVLGRFPPNEARDLPAIVRVADDAIESVLWRGVKPAMNEFNKSWLPSDGAGDSAVQ
ncbi:MAG: aminoacyl-tRNA hydrolase [Chloroflexota bacterium]